MDFDLTDPRLLLRADVLEDPSAFHDHLRAVAPIYQIPGQDTFLVADPRLIREAVRRPEDFSSNLVSALHNDGEGRPVPFPILPFGHEFHTLSTADAPIHTHHRALLQPHLSPAAVAALEPAVRQIVDELLDEVLADGRVDAVASFTDPVPARTICEALGLTTADAAQVLRHAADTSVLLDGITDADGVNRAAGAAMELAGFVSDRLGEALARPAAERRGIIGVFCDQIEAGDVTTGDAESMLVVFVTAGAETTASLLATAVARLAADQDLQARWRSDPAVIPDAIEGLLRDEGPFQFHYRFAPNATVLGGTAIPAGSRVLLMWAAANRPDPESPAPDPGDAVAPHFAFGRGLHFCIGAPLARLEARVALERLLERTSSITLVDDQPPTRRPSIFIRRHATIPVNVAEAHASASS